MITIHPKILEKNGIKEFVVISFEEFQKIQDELQDYEDLKLLRKAKHAEHDINGMTLAEAREKFDV
ncbi:MAG: type II toxin-antitoxin system Phd/YefM family antitoxin [Kiritimatiellae bacterium]|jgi:PHD/YefM family antitoxin component YafN of YafNO toxin-antitoxin module|nr:type II toxin-antitoxin system Phd/YefM family antitoxin [Kiritimatiellia bacterium]